MAVLLNSTGRPEPSSEISRRLRAIHAGLHLRFVEHTGEHWAICVEWDRGDGRWQYVQNGALDPDATYDIVGYLPLTCGADEAPAYLERSFRTFPRSDIQQMANRVNQYNAGVTSDMAEQALAEVLDMADPSATKSRKRSKKVS